MKREAIERLLAAYVSGDCTAEELEQIEALFEEDPSLRAEAAELSEVWAAIGEPKPSAAADARFYEMMTSEAQWSAGAGSSTRRRLLWPAVAAAACLLTFFTGRLTVQPVIEVREKLVYVPAPVKKALAENSAPLVKGGEKRVTRVAPVQPAPVKFPDAVASPKMPAGFRDDMRSIYASERIAAIERLGQADLQRPEILGALGLALREDPNPSVRLVIVRTLQPLVERQAVQAVLISALERQDDIFIQSSLVNLLVNARSKQAVPHLINLLESGKTTLAVQNTIRDGIEEFLYN